MTIAISLIITCCTNSGSSNLQQQSNIKNGIQQLADNYLKNYAKFASVTAISITARCESRDLISVLSGSIGLNDIRPLTESNLFQIGSLTKSFTAITLLMILNDPQYKNMQLNLNNTVGTILGLDVYPQWNDITIKQLINMSSGLPDYTKDQQLMLKYLQNPMQKISSIDILDSQKNKSLDFSPSGIKYAYNNTNYLLLGELIRKITGNDPGIEIKKRIIDKLRLSNTYYIYGLPQDEVDPLKLVHGYSIEGAFDPTLWNLSILGSSGALISTSHDINVFANALFTPNNLLSTDEIQILKTTFISESSASEIVSPSVTDPLAYGLGFEGVYSKDYGVIYRKYGRTFGFTAVYYYDPSTKISVAVNVNGASDKIENLYPIATDVLNYLIKTCN